MILGITNAQDSKYSLKEVYPVAETAELSVSSYDGDIDLADLTGNFTAKTSDGDIVVKNVSGDLVTKTADGSVIHSDH